MNGQPLMQFEMYDPDKHDTGEPPVDFDTADLYEELCGNEQFYADGTKMDEACPGRVVSTGGQHHYSNGFDCYTMYLECEFCGPYEVECV